MYTDLNIQAVGMRILALLFFVLFGFSGNAFTAERDGVSFADKVSNGGQELVLNGLGTRKATIFGVRVYVAGLYLLERSKNPEQILKSSVSKTLIMRFVRNVSATEMIDAWKGGLEKNNDNYTILVPKLEELTKGLGDTKIGDEIIMEFSGDSVQLKAKGGVQNLVKGKDFAEAILKIWLGPKPPNEELKEGLLGN